MGLLGHVGILTHRRIVGWAWDPGAPDVPVIVLIGIAGRLLGRCDANLFREDLAIEGFGTGRCGFALDLPPGALSLRQGYEISVRREGDGEHLPGSPYVLQPAIRIVPDR
ncbi:hypothetical protein MKK75_13255 [Methylobacterium sp. J-030]|uniref:hypothetical protein n=1 Tax=Methylobacterium sp. J-030 TaxID=2836627 RepID=UPI001FBA6349|nr:hypothetical protein [Methylobacterium sp. J-030]MCJ2069745.1 hypothetical protein [Methylobacterium sp. J-030]